MAKRQIELTSERPMAGGVADHAPAVIRVRKQSKYGRVTYYMNNWLPVPAVLRHLDGRTWRGLLLALLVLIGVAVAVVRLIGGAK